MLAVGLAALVVVVAMVARNSMIEVGVDTPRAGQAELPTRTAHTSSFVIVQLASFPSREEARTEVETLAEGSGPPLRVLHSDLYEPMDEGWWVVYAGPFEDTAQGRARAAALTGTVEGSFVRTLNRR